MAIWFNPDVSLQRIQELGKNTMSEHLGIEFIERGDDFMKARMPVDHRTVQPYGLLHGGASATLAETIGSLSSALVIDHTLYRVVGIEINVNHLKSARSGWVTAMCTPLHLGKSTHVWDIKIRNENDELVAVSRLTVAVIKNRG